MAAAHPRRHHSAKITVAAASESRSFSSWDPANAATTSERSAPIESAIAIAGVVRISGVTVGRDIACARLRRLHSCCFRTQRCSLDAQPVEQPVVTAPALPHPDLKVEEYLSSELALELAACRAADVAD